MVRIRGLAALEEGVASLLPPRSGRSYWPHQPYPKQEEFLALDAPEALYGGAAGGGKSDALLMGALEHVHVPGYAGLLLRRTYKDLNLPGAIMDRAKTWLAGSPASWDDDAKTFTFPGGGRLTFGYLQTDKDRFRYQSAEFQYVGFDELTQFPERWYTYLSSRMRRPATGPLSKVPLRLRGASNPGGIGHEWVRRRFVDGELPFVPALLSDNPSVDAEAYLKNLSVLDAHTARQLRDGVWATDSSGLVYRLAQHNLVRDPPALDRYVLGVDFGYSDACAFVEWGWSERARRAYVTRVHRQEGMTPSDAAELVRGWMSQRTYDRIVADVGGLGKGYAEEGRRRFQIPYQPAQKGDKRGYISLFNGAMERGEIQVFPGCDALLAEWAELPWNEDRSDYAHGFLDHLSDAALYGWRETAGWLVALPAEAPVETQAAALAREEAEMEERITRSWRKGGRNSWARKMLS